MVIISETGYEMNHQDYLILTILVDGEEVRRISIFDINTFKRRI